MPKTKRRSPSSRASIERSARLSVYERDDYRCRYCGWTPPALNPDEKATFRGLNFLTLDHIQPRSRGGTNVKINLQTLCFLCNAAKANGKAPRPTKRAYLEQKRRQERERKRRAEPGTYHLLPRYQTA